MLLLLQVLVSVLGNSATATKLQTARTISLSGDVSGSASFDGSKNVTINTDLANIAVLTGTAVNGVANINYPSGFNSNNCVVISQMYKRTGSSTGFNSGTTLEISNGSSGALPNIVELLPANIRVKLRLLYISSNNTVFSGNVDFNVEYKIMLMKI